MRCQVLVRLKPHWALVCYSCSIWVETFILHHFLHTLHQKVAHAPNMALRTSHTVMHVYQVLVRFKLHLVLVLLLQFHMTKHVYSHMYADAVICEWNVGGTSAHKAWHLITAICEHKRLCTFKTIFNSSVQIMLTIKMLYYSLLFSYSCDNYPNEYCIIIIIIIIIIIQALVPYSIM
jgi:hypothetical protein